MILAWLWACLEPQKVSEPITCDPRLLSPGEVRVRVVPCKDELIAGGSGNNGDWLLENALVRFVIRQQSSLSDPHAAGGSIVDGALSNERDGLIELLPMWEHNTLRSAHFSSRVTSNSAHLDIQGTLPSGEEVFLSYGLQADSDVLELEGTSQWKLVPISGSEVHHGVIAPAYRNFVFSTDGAAEDLKGHIMLSEMSRLFVGDWKDAGLVQDSSAVWVSGSAQGEWVEGLDEDDIPVGRLPIVQDQYSGWLSSDAHSLRVLKTGCHPGEVSPINASPNMEHGACGSILIRVQGDEGQPIPATLWWNNTHHPVLPGGERIPIPPGEGNAFITAGPAWSTQEWRTDPGEEPTLSVTLTRMVPDSLMTELSLLGTPDEQERRPDEEVLRESAARGTRFAVIAPRDIVAKGSQEADEHWRSEIQALGGSQTRGPLDPIQGWPWSSSSSKPGYGSAPYEALDPMETFAMVARKQRYTMVGTEWLQQAEPPGTLSYMPDFLWMNDWNDLDTYYTALDHRMPIGPVGVKTWVTTLSDQAYHPVDVMHEILSHHLTAGNGPHIHLQIGNENLPAPQIFVQGDRIDEPASFLWGSITLSATTWAAPEKLALVQDGGVIIAEWDVTELPMTRTFEPPEANWIVAVAYGGEPHWLLNDETPFAVTAPLWLKP